MEETAFFLQSVLYTDMPVVLVGSMRPSTAIGADGPANLYEAMRVAAAPESRGRGVLVVLDDTIHAARWVQKTNTTSVRDIRFAECRSGRICRPGTLRFVTPAAPPAYLRAAGIGALAARRHRLCPCQHGRRAVEDAVKRGAKGIVLAGVGDGNGSKQRLMRYRRPPNRVWSQCAPSRVGSGYVNRNVEVDDDKLGSSVSLDLNPQKARILAQLLIANGVTSPRRFNRRSRGRS